jgi:hypothetical protein
MERHLRGRRDRAVSCHIMAARVPLRVALDLKVELRSLSGMTRSDGKGTLGSRKFGSIRELLVSKGGWILKIIDHEVRLAEL